METEGREEAAQRQKNLILLDMTLKALSEVPSKPYNEEMKQEVSRRLSRQLWPALPNDVTELDLGNARISREPEAIEKIPPHQRKSWNSQQIDQHAATVARAIGKPYTLK